jgi:hypothetical protein
LHTALRHQGLGNPLPLAVFVPARASPMLVKIGLAGTGAMARTIAESIQPVLASH